MGHEVARSCLAARSTDYEGVKRFTGQGCRHLGLRYFLSNQPSEVLQALVPIPTTSISAHIRPHPSYRLQVFSHSGLTRCAIQNRDVSQANNQAIQRRLCANLNLLGKRPHRCRDQQPRVRCQRPKRLVSQVLCSAERTNGHVKAGSGVKPVLHDRGLDPGPVIKPHQR